MAKKPTKKQEVAPPKGDRALYFARDRWLGVMIVGIVTIAGGWLAWHIRGCLDKQKEQLTTARKAWTNAQTTYQKNVASMEAFLVQSEFLEEDARDGVPRDMIDLHLKALFDITQTRQNDCDAYKTSMYEFSREMKALSRSYSSTLTTRHDFDFATLCEGLPELTETLRTASKSGFPDSEWLATFDAEHQKYEAQINVNKESLRKLNTDMEALFDKLEDQGFVRRVRQCF